MSLREHAIQQVYAHANTLQGFRDLLELHFEPAVALLVGALKGGNKILLIGNGGSAAEAQHMAAELTIRFETDRQALAAIALTADSAALTACGNDYGYQNVFKRQIEALGRSQDVLVAFSTSGTSKNVVEGIHAARRAGMHVLGISGRKGMTAECDIDLICPGGNTARIQELHLLLVHLLVEAIERSL